MTRRVELPPDEPPTPDGVRAAGWWHEDERPGRLVCDVCPRGCTVAPDEAGFCFVRQNRGGRMVSITYGRSTGFSIDPIEKKPLHHFYPGTAVLSFGTAGCNLGCKCCQNWTSSRSREVDRQCELALPEAIAQAAHRLECQSVAFTYNDPIVWAEYAIDTAKACRALGVKTVAVTNGYMQPAARAEFYRWMDAANVDLKALDDAFYRRVCAGRLDPVLDTLRWLVRETDVWLEITNLVIPDENDSPDALARLCDWVAEDLGPDVPVHFSAFHPDFHMTGHRRTPPETLVAAHGLARKAGLRYVYTGNVPDPRHQATYCPGCGQTLIARDGYRIGAYALARDACGHCGHKIAGRFADAPGRWGARRQSVRIADFASPRRKEEPDMTPPIDPAHNPPPDAPGRPALTPEQENAVFQAAGRRVAAAVGAGTAPARLSGELAHQPLLGAFVSLKRAGQLRSCCGFMGEGIPLGEAIDQAALRAARDDPRFPPISPSELDHLDMEVWLLWGLQQVAARGPDRAAAIEIGRHGLQIHRGGTRGLLLPAVAVEHGLDAEGFLRQVCLKAHLPPDAWLDDQTQLFTFEGYAIHGPLADAAGHAGAAAPHGPSEDELDQLVGFCRTNLAAMVEGATPNYFLPGGFDGAVSGLFLRVDLPGGSAPIEVGRLVMKPGVPLQSTLFTLLQAASEQFRAREIDARGARAAEIGLTILWDPALHGTADRPDLAGIDPRHRTVLAMGASGWAWSYDPEELVEGLLRDALAKLHLGPGAAASVVSLAVASNRPSARATNVPDSDAPRPPTVAGRFYPARADQINVLLDRFLANRPEPKPWTGAMVPHAGWIYSGRLAADVLGRVAIPDTVIVVAPKHNPVGADWAVAPFRRWTLPGGGLDGDPELARRLAESVSGLELDAAAHRPEHAIEVVLPILARLAPRCRVVGMTLHGGQWADLARLAEQLADVLRALPAPPLLVISTDMNHFADDARTRELDRMALDAVESLDPRRVLDTVRENNISMCGVVPTVVVMETLRRLGRLNRCEPVGYATSAEASGDTARVVGYAGMLFE
ncbi:MAG: AmmeMemoRadiSam system radical SAM enzyme [Pirellulales bacterium]|nr:AmmeMemoRadiSam system radical SAM enzyme [Pirellulales bacterium]